MNILDEKPIDEKPTRICLNLLCDYNEDKICNSGYVVFDKEGKCETQRRMLKGDNGEVFASIRKMKQCVMEMTNDELIECWKSLQAGYINSKYYDKGIPDHEWILAVYGEMRTRQEAIVKNNEKFDR